MDLMVLMMGRKSPAAICRKIINAKLKNDDSIDVKVMVRIDHFYT